MAPPAEGTYLDLKDDSVDGLPVAAVEAKGDSTDQVRVAIAQAHRHLGEVNVVFAVVPRSDIALQDHALARDLSVGLLLTDENSAELVEKPRLVGIGSSHTTGTICFHATLGGTAIESFTKNHPKNAVGYALALSHDDPTERLFRETVIESVNDARLDALSLGLIERRTGDENLTAMGKDTVRAASCHHGGPRRALDAIDDLTDSPRRFVDSCPVMGTLARRALLEYPPKTVLVESIEQLMISGADQPSLAQVATSVADDSLEFALDLFVASADRERAPSCLNESDPRSAFRDGSIYSTHTTLQYKAMLYHVGLLTERGTGTKSKIDPEMDTWALENTEGN